MVVWRCVGAWRCWRVVVRRVCALWVLRVGCACRGVLSVRGCRCVVVAAWWRVVGVCRAVGGWGWWSCRPGGRRAARSFLRSCTAVLRCASVASSLRFALGCARKLAPPGTSRCVFASPGVDGAPATCVCSRSALDFVSCVSFTTRWRCPSPPWLRFDFGLRPHPLGLVVTVDVVVGSVGGRVVSASVVRCVGVDTCPVVVRLGA